MALSQALLPEFEHEMVVLRRVVDRIPADRLDFRPHPKSFSLGDLANHLVTIPGWTVSTLTETELDFGLPEAQARYDRMKPAASEVLKALRIVGDYGEAQKLQERGGDTAVGMRVQTPSSTHTGSKRVPAESGRRRSPAV